MLDTQPSRKNPTGIPARVDRMVEAASEANRPFIRLCVEQRRNEQQKPPSIYNWAHVACRYDRFLNGVPFMEGCVPERLTAFLGGLRVEVGPRTLRCASTHLKVLWRDLHDTDQLPRMIRKALMVKVPRDAPSGELISDQDFEALLREAALLRGGSQGVPASLTWTALLWVLWDAGLRANEALHLKVRDVEFTGERTARIHLRADGRPLKTGPRIVPVSDCVPALKALLSMHPHEQGDDSPLFLARKRKSGTGRMRYLSLNRGLDKLAIESGANERRPWTANITPHDFRHTCATRKARLGWNEAQLRKFFGWLDGSKMAAYYVRLRIEDVEVRVRLDAGLTPHGMVAKVEDLMQAGLSSGEAVSATEDWLRERVRRLVEEAVKDLVKP